MTQTTPTALALDGIMANILAFMLPLFLTAAGGDPDRATATIRALIDPYNATTPDELDLVGRIVGYSASAMDNLRLSMNPGLPDARILSYRSNAVTLSRASDQARKLLEALRAGQDQRPPAPAPTVASASPALKPAPPAALTRKPASNTPAAAASPRPSTVPPAISASQAPEADIETMKRDARAMLHALARQGSPAAAFPLMPDLAASVDAAARAPSRPPCVPAAVERCCRQGAAGGD